MGKEASASASASGGAEETDTGRRRIIYRGTT